MKDIIEKILKAKTIWLAGDGGSAALADHFACDLLKNCNLPAISLCSNSALITAIGNDHSFDRIFSYQLKILFHQGDLLILFSTSGNSKNLVNAAFAANNTISFLGNKDCSLAKVSSLCEFFLDGSQMEVEDQMLKYCHELVKELKSR